LNGKEDNPPRELVGKPSDASPEILATGRSDITTLFVSMAARDPSGADADYLRWHTLDHRPEQYRLASVRSSLRTVSTPACRQARAAEDEEFSVIDHVMTYFFSGVDGLEEFNALAVALRDAGRSPFILPPVQRGVYKVADRIAAARARVGADVLPWLPVRGIYLLLEEGEAAPDALLAVPGVAGVWTAGAIATGFSTAGPGQRFTLCFLDDDPVDTALRLRDVLRQRWAETGVHPLLAAPFHTIVPYEWDRYLPQPEPPRAS